MTTQDPAADAAFQRWKARQIARQAHDTEEPWASLPGYEPLPLPPPNYFEGLPFADYGAQMPLEVGVQARRDQPPLASEDFGFDEFYGGDFHVPYVRPQHQDLIDAARQKAPPHWMDRLGQIGARLADALSGKKPYYLAPSSAGEGAALRGGGGGMDSPSLTAERAGHLDTIGNLYLRQLAAQIAAEALRRAQPLRSSYRPAASRSSGPSEGGA
jgi:hypothetical protein